VCLDCLLLRASRKRCVPTMNRRGSALRYLFFSYPFGTAAFAAALVFIFRDKVGELPPFGGWKARGRSQIHGGLDSRFARESSSAPGGTRKAFAAARSSFSTECVAPLFMKPAFSAPPANSTPQLASTHPNPPPSSGQSPLDPGR